MGKIIDLTGQKFGRLTVLSRYGANRHRDSIWICECECGQIVKILRGDLKSGKTKSCGCLWREMREKTKGENHQVQEFIYR